ncbi:hypothetical protein GEMRC1_008709 [Eukaryota sp. GEM-RC1]
MPSIHSATDPFDRSSVIHFPDTDVFPKVGSSHSQSSASTDDVSDSFTLGVLSTPPHKSSKNLVTSWVDGQNMFSPETKLPTPPKTHSLTTASSNQATVKSNQSDSLTTTLATQTPLSISPSYDLLLNPSMVSVGDLTEGSRVFNTNFNTSSTRRSLVFSPSKSRYSPGSRGSIKTDWSPRTSSPIMNPFVMRIDSESSGLETEWLSMSKKITKLSASPKTFFL